MGLNGLALVMVDRPARRSWLDIRKELRNRYDHPELTDVRRELLGRLYTRLDTRGDPFAGWVGAMLDVDG